MVNCRVAAFLKLFILSLIALLPSKVFAYRFAVYGDSRAPKGDPTLVNKEVLGFINQHMNSLDPKPDFVLFIGDAMNRAWVQNYTHNNMPDWIHFMRSGLRHIPFYMVAGNTEFYGNTGWTEFPLQTEYQKSFHFLPDNGPKHYKKLAYYVQHGKGGEKSLFVILDAFGFYQSPTGLENFDNGFDEEQIQWFKKVVEKSHAKHKFVISHGPAFSVEGWPIKDSVREVWKEMTKNRVDLYFCGHEHVFSRWFITKDIFPDAKKSITQTIVGSAGAVPDNPTKIVVDPIQAHIHHGFTYVIVDVKEDKIVQRSYLLQSLPTGGYTTKLIDRFVLKK